MQPGQRIPDSLYGDAARTQFLNAGKLTSGPALPSLSLVPDLIDAGAAVFIPVGEGEPVGPLQHKAKAREPNRAAQARKPRLCERLVEHQSDDVCETEDRADTDDVGQ